MNLIHLIFSTIIILNLYFINYNHKRNFNEKLFELITSNDNHLVTSSRLLQNVKNVCKIIKSQVDQNINIEDPAVLKLITVIV